LSRRRRLFKLKLNEKSIRSIFSVVLFLGAVFFIISYFSPTIISTAFFPNIEYFLGKASILLPVLLILLALNLSDIKWALAESRILLGFALIFFGFLGLLGLFSFDNGGWLGRKEAFLLSQILTGLGAFFVFLGAFLGAILLIFNSSLEGLVAFLSSIILPLQNFIKAKDDKDNLGQAEKTIKKEEALLKAKESAEEKPIKIKGLDPSFEVIDEDFEVKIRSASLEAQPGFAEALRQGEQSELTPEKTVFAKRVNESTAFALPSFSILPDNPPSSADRGDIKKNAATIEKTLESFGIQAKVAEVNLGPSVTQYALELTEGTKIAKITALQNDLALSLAASTGTVRIEAPIAGRSLVGIEVPNYSPTLVSLKSVLTSDIMQTVRSKLVVALGHNVAGEPVVADIARWPHILIAGSTGSGKSVLIHSFLASILFRATPDEVRFILVDPKRVELTQYNGIPHLLTPVIVETERVVSSLKWSVAEMEKRYKLFAQAGARNLQDFNQKSAATSLPFIIIVVDELADLMAFAATEVESLVTRIAQMSRATGIHLVLSTQRPSVDVITGLIKANIPARISLNVSSSIDSRVIIDSVGAEKLLGRGDLLYLPPESSKPQRIQGVFVSDAELNLIIDYWKKFAAPLQSTPTASSETPALPVLGQGEPASPKLQRGEPVLALETNGRVDVLEGEENYSQDDLFNQAAQIIFNHRYASTSLLQRRLRIGYARAARLIDEMEEAGFVGPKNGASPRDVNILKFENYLKKPR